MANVAAPAFRSVGPRARTAANVVGVVCFVLVAVVVLPEYLLAQEMLPEIWDMFADLGIVCALGALLLRRPSVTDGGLSRAAARGLLLGLVLVAFVGAGAAAVSLVHHMGIAVGLGALVVLTIATIPLRAFVAWRTDVTIFGNRDEPYRVITGLGRILETAADRDAVLARVVHTVAGAFKLPYLAIEVADADGHRIEAARGLRSGPVTRVPLAYQGVDLGELVFATEADDRLTSADRRLLDDLARQISSGMYCARLMRDLRTSHAALIAAREEERRRLRRDLHDGLGPMLAGIGLASQAARNLITDDPDASDALLDRVVKESQAATAEVRRLVDGLRPPELDELGLVDALRKQVRIVFAGGSDGVELPVVVVADGDLGDLSPAAEIAAYRIALEALVNVIKHARAQSCVIRIEVTGSLHVSIADDGVGIDPGATPGVGIASMRARAEELGGRCLVQRRASGGTVVDAALPLLAPLAD